MNVSARDAFTLYQGLSLTHVAPAVESEIERGMLALLQQMPDQSTRLSQLTRSNERSAFDGGAATVPCCSP